MITKLNKVKKLGVFDDFIWDGTKLTDFATKNLIYAYNGGGKTTLSNIFRLLSSLETETQKMEIFLELSTGSDTAIETEANGKKISFKADKPLDAIYVFNCDFITDHIYDGTTAKMRRFDAKVKSNLKDKEINELENDIATKQKGQRESGEAIEALKIQFDHLKNKYSADFGKKISNKRLSNVVIEVLPADIKTAPEIEKELEHYIRNYQISLELDQLKADLAILKELTIESITVNIPAVVDLLSKNIINQTSERIKKKISAYKVIEETEGGSIEGWYKQGKALLEHACIVEPVECPLCHTDISSFANIVLEEYRFYFNDAYEKFVNQLATAVLKLPELVAQVSANNDAINKIKSLLSKYATKDFSTIIFESSSLITSLQHLQQLFQKKQTNIKEDVSQGLDTVAFTKLLEQYTTYLSAFTTAQKDLIDALEKQNLDPKKLLTEIKEKYKQLILLAFDQGENSASNITKYFDYQKKVQNLELEIIQKETALGKARAKLKSEAKHVNRYLKELGIHHFTIDILETKPSENIEIIFESGTKKSKLKHSISDGEKTALCLAYFLSKIQFEVIDNATTSLGQCVIVLDDPVTSLDENRLYTTACLINEKLTGAKQLFVLSHNIVFMKFMGNILGPNNRSDYFLSNHRGQVCLENLPYALTNYTTVYFQKLNDINQFNEGTLAYKNGKNFIPNNIRVVLEAFLSFKLCVLKNGPKDENRLAGLDRLINQINANLGSFKHYRAVGNIDITTLVPKLRKIQRVTDPQSHGSPQSIHEFNYINENELRGIAEDTLNIIRFLDGLHYDKALEN